MPLPMAVSICVTDHCPLSCRHCLYLQACRLNKNMLAYRDLEPVLDEMQRSKVYLVPVTGGEPLVHPELLDILRGISSRGMLPLMGTSGIGLKKGMAERFYEAGVRCIQVGLNGSRAEVSDPYRGPGTFVEAMGSVRLLQEAGINVNLAFCFDGSNFHDMRSCLELAYGAGAYRVKIEYWKDIGGGVLPPLTKEQRLRGREVCSAYAARCGKPANWIDSPSAVFRVEGREGVAEIHNKSLVIDADGAVLRGELSAPLGNIRKNTLAGCLAAAEKNAEEK